MKINIKIKATEIHITTTTTEIPITGHTMTHRVPIVEILVTAAESATAVNLPVRIKCMQGVIKDHGTTM